MAAEIMETTRLYARTCARLDPLWALELGAHLLRVSAQRAVLECRGKGARDGQAAHAALRPRARERAVELRENRSAHATEIFIREGLVNDTITFPLDCLAHNRAVREKLETCSRARGTAVT
jgi:ATP-dependent helicase HrpA